MGGGGGDKTDWLNEWMDGIGCLAKNWIEDDDNDGDEEEEKRKLQPKSVTLNSNKYLIVHNVQIHQSFGIVNNKEMREWK